MAISPYVSFNAFNDLSRFCHCDITVRSEFWLMPDFLLRSCRGWLSTLVAYPLMYPLAYPLSYPRPSGGKISLSLT
jgi:hypothetical protein